MNVERQCGECTLCCKLLPMRPEKKGQTARTIVAMAEHGIAPEPASLVGMMREFLKPAGERCPHQSHSAGCRVYPRRPLSCRLWSCRWLVNNDTAKLRRPDRSRYVIDLVPDFITIHNNETGEDINVEVVQIWVDPNYRDAWRDPALLAYIERRGREGKAAFLRFNSADDALTVFPPSMSNDGAWHEIAGGEIQRDRTAVERLAGIAKARKVVLEGG